MSISLPFLKRLMSTISPSGYEDEASRVWREEAATFADEVTVDYHGNTLAVVNPGGHPRIMLAGHIDEIGFQITYIDDKGFLYFRPIGGWDRTVLPGQRVWIRTRDGVITGVIGKKPIHLMRQEEREKVPKFEDLWIDIGAKDKEEAEELVQIGDPAVLAYGFEELRNGLLAARGFDDRIGAFVVLETLRAVKELQPQVAVYAVATVQEEIGLRGARTSAYRIAPQVGIAVDVTFATDHPKMEGERQGIGDIRLGGGPVIARGPNISPVVYRLLTETARELEIPYQIEGIPGGTGTDANVIQLTREGVATGLVSVPNRYMHSPCEMVSVEDLENIVKLLAHTVARVTPQTDLTPF